MRRVALLLIGLTAMTGCEPKEKKGIVIGQKTADCSLTIDNLAGTDWQILEILRDHANRPGAAVTKLIETANYHGGRDNISVILAQVCAD